jgi:hypothetical protein
MGFHSLEVLALAAAVASGYLLRRSGFGIRDLQKDGSATDGRELEDRAHCRGSKVGKGEIGIVIRELRDSFASTRNATLSMISSPRRNCRDNLTLDLGPHADLKIVASEVWVGCSEIFGCP